MWEIDDEIKVNPELRTEIPIVPAPVVLYVSSVSTSPLRQENIH